MAENDRRETIREAIRSLSQDETEPEEVVEEVEEQPESTEADSDPVAEPAEEVEESKEPAPQGDKARDGKGRFAPEGKKPPAAEAKQPKPAAVKAPESKPAVVAPPPGEQKPAPVKPAGTEVRPPQSLKPAAREAWAKLAANPDARPLLEDIARVEGETRRVLNENAGLRKTVTEAQTFRQGVEQLVSPVSGFFASEGMNPGQGLISLVNTYAALRGPRANEVLAGMIQQYGSIEGINAFLEGQPAQAQQRPHPQQVEQPRPQVDPREIVRQELAAARREAEVQQADAELDSFLRSKDGGEPEFIRDVWQDMMLLLDAAHGQGRKLTYEQAYNRALKMNEDVQSVLTQRAAAAAAITPPSAPPAQRARVAAATSKPRSAPGGGAPANDPTDRRATIERAMQKARGQ